MMRSSWLNAWVVRIDGHPAASAPGLPGHGGDAPRLGQRAVDELLAQRGVVGREVCNGDASWVSETGSTQIEKVSPILQMVGSSTSRVFHSQPSSSLALGTGQNGAGCSAGRSVCGRKPALCALQRPFRLAKPACKGVDLLLQPTPVFGVGAAPVAAVVEIVVAKLRLRTQLLGQGKRL